MAFLLIAKQKLSSVALVWYFRGVTCSNLGEALVLQKRSEKPRGVFQSNIFVQPF